MNFWTHVALRVAALAYGLFTLTLFILNMVVTGDLFRGPSAKFANELAAARQQLWSLRKSPSAGGIRHRFLTLKDGLKLHYVTAEPIDAAARNLVIFLHGFPDSWALWKYHLLSSKLRENAVLVALDLPGYGGSGELAEYDATGILEVVSHFMLAMKEQYINSRTDSPAEKARLILVAHDWGGIIAFRLASEAPQLADRFIIAAAVHPPLAIGNISTRWKTVAAMFRSWKRNPRALKLLKKSVATFFPLLTQLRNSRYIVVFNLPSPLANVWGPLGNFWFFRVTHWLTTRSKVPNAELMASCVGPSEAECGEVPDAETTNDDADGDAGPLAYPPAVRARAREGGWSTKIRYYRDGLIFKPWNKSMEIMWALTQEEQATSLAARRRSSAGAALFDSGPEGSLKAKTTILWGARDFAGEARVALEGVEDYLSKGSQILFLQHSGHWMPLERDGKTVIEDVVKWAVDGERTKLKDLVDADPSRGVRITAER